MNAIDSATQSQDCTTYYCRDINPEETKCVIVYLSFMTISNLDDFLQPCAILLSQPPVCRNVYLSESSSCLDNLHFHDNCRDVSNRSLLRKFAARTHNCLFHTHTHTAISDLTLVRPPCF